MMAVHRPTCLTYDKQADSFHLLFVIVPCFVLALLLNEFFTFYEVLYTFSIYLEAVAILPQLIVVHRAAQNNSGFVENLTSHYVFSLGGYRFFYLINWIYRIATEDGYRNWIVWIAGLVQTGIYCDFFYYFLVAKMEGKSMSLPI
jgi:ER lumen protein retaining receptor